MSSVNSARVKARNAVRISAIEQLRNAIHLASSNSKFPDDTGGVGFTNTYPCLTTTCSGGYSAPLSNVNAIVDAYLAPYIKKPVDPQDSTRTYGGFLLFTPENTGSTLYMINYTLEPGANNCGPGVKFSQTATHIGCYLIVDI